MSQQNVDRARDFIAAYKRRDFEYIRDTGLAGDDIEKAVYYPKDERYLIEQDETVTHYEVAVTAEPR